MDSIIAVAGRNIYEIVWKCGHVAAGTEDEKYKFCKMNELKEDYFTCEEGYYQLFEDLLDVRPSLVWDEEGEMLTILNDNEDQ